MFCNNFCYSLLSTISVAYKLFTEIVFELTYWEILIIFLIN